MCVCYAMRCTRGTHGTHARPAQPSTTTTQRRNNKIGPGPPPGGVCRPRPRPRRDLSAAAARELRGAAVCRLGSRGVWGCMCGKGALARTHTESVKVDHDHHLQPPTIPLQIPPTTNKPTRQPVPDPTYLPFSLAPTRRLSASSRRWSASASAPRAALPPPAAQQPGGERRVLCAFCGPLCGGRAADVHFAGMCAHPRMGVCGCVG